MSGNDSIAVVILTHNDSQHLARALRHITSFADEIFLVDSFSTDNTLDIAKSFGVPVLQHSFQNQARQLRWGLEHAAITTDWVMWLQPDEIVEADLAENVKEQLSSLTSEVTGVLLNRKTIFKGKFIRWGGEYPSWLLRIWRNGAVRIVDLWTDDCVYLTGGRPVKLNGGFAVFDLSNLVSITQKLNRYSALKAFEMLRKRICLTQSDSRHDADVDSARLAIEGRLKEYLYNHIPFELSALGCFFNRYILKLGFLDGRAGLTYQIVRGLWYPFMVGAKVREFEGVIGNALSSEDALRSIEHRVSQISEFDSAGES